MLYGWTGKRLVVDLTLGQSWEEQVPQSWRLDFIGGRGVNSRTLYEEIKPGTDPLQPENVLLYGVGPVNGTIVPGSGRCTITALSPLTLVGGGQFPCFGDTNFGGFWGAELKYAGYDQLLIRGRAEKPVYLFINEHGAVIRSAEGIWGRDVWEADREIRKQLKEPLAQLAVIGPAGENLVRFANVIHNLSRAAGKCGIGAVMGSKNLKAVAVRGNGPVRIANPARLKEVVSKAMEVLANDPSAQIYAAYGTSSLTAAQQKLGRVAAYNCQESQFDGWKELDSDSFARYWTKSKGCFACPLHCGHYYRVESGKFAGVAGEGPEHATIGSFGFKQGNADTASILAFNNQLNKMGIDCVNSGSAISWAMECYQRGIISRSETDGLEIAWGNVGDVMRLVERIARREGDFARLLGEGAYRASRVIGRGSGDYVIHVKAQDPGLSDPRVAHAWGLGYAVASRGGCHLRALATGETFFTPEEAERMFGSADAVKTRGVKGKGRLVKWQEEHRAAADSLEICKFVVRTSLMYPHWLSDFMEAVTGMEISGDEVMKTGERIVNLERCFNLRQGLTPADDTLSRRHMEEPIPHGPYKGQYMQLKPMLEEYYQARGWDLQTGMPGENTLKSLGLKDIVAGDLRTGQG